MLMKYFPISLNIAGRRCTVVGGGRVAARKVEALLEYGGDVRVISPELTEELQKRQHAGRIDWLPRNYQQGDLSGSFLVIAATDDQQVQEKVYSEAGKTNQLVNVADVPERCNFILPATVTRENLTVSVSTAGNSPALARRLRQELETTIRPEHGILGEMLGLIRPEILKTGQSHEENKLVFAELLHERFSEWIKDKDWPSIEKHLRKTLGDNIDPDCLNSLKKMLDCD
jgi:precorrin-2 dehydrogenase/sirohydrochlorin ferrochelatase